MGKSQRSARAVDPSDHPVEQRYDAGAAGRFGRRESKEALDSHGFARSKDAIGQTSQQGVCGHIVGGPRRICDESLKQRQLALTDAAQESFA